MSYYPCPMAWVGGVLSSMFADTVPCFATHAFLGFYVYNLQLDSNIRSEIVYL